MEIQKETIKVKGMHCASCAYVIQNTLCKVDGVEACEVNYGNEKAKIEYDQSKTNLEELSKKIEPFGYTLDLNTHIMPDGAKMQNHQMHGMDHSAHLGLDQSKEEKLKELKEQKRKVQILLPITLAVFFFMLWQILSGTFGNLPKFFLSDEIYNSILLIISTVVMFTVGTTFLKEVVTFIKYRVSTMYTLVGIGTFTAYSFSTMIVLFPQVVKLLNLPMHTYFDVTIVVIGFVYFGKYMETKSKLQTGEAIQKLLNLQAKTALVERDGQEVEIPADQVKVGDIIIVKPGSKIPVDGVIIEGGSSIDESMITGEPLPVDKTLDDSIIGGTINKQGSFKFKASKVGSETLLAYIIKMVDEAQGSKAPIQKLADKISEVFVPAVLSIALISLIAWIIIGSQYFPFDQALSFGLVSFVGVLVIACPCALGLATPTAIIVGTGVGAKNGILIKDAESLEKLHKVNTVVTDKTGTITKGKPEVTEILIIDDLFKDESEVLRITASLEKNSEHPLALAILNKANIDGSEKGLSKVEEFQIIEGKGVKGKVDSQEYFAGNLKLLDDLDLDFDKKMLSVLTQKGETPVILMTSQKVIALIGISDTVKDNAKATVQSLHKLGIKVVMLTGDNDATARYIASQVGIDEVIAEVLPGEKSEQIKKLQSKGDTVAMVGDGINDAPALAQADIGIAMGTGTDVAIESAGITLLKGDFSKVLQAIKLSRFTMRAIKQNLFWAFSYNIIGIPLASGLLYPFLGILLSPAFAGMAMAFSSVSVVLNSLRLRYIKI